MQEESKEVRVKWSSDRQRDVATASGYRLRGGQVEVIKSRGNSDDGSHYHIVASVRPATLAEQAMWDLLMKGEPEWTTSSN